jgi:hypothetical protein
LPTFFHTVAAANKAGKAALKQLLDCRPSALVGQNGLIA